MVRKNPLIDQNIIKEVSIVEKKQHTKKNNLLATRSTDILYLSPIYTGSMLLNKIHYKRIRYKLY